jgi:hypothetical protein
VTALVKGIKEGRVERVENSRLVNPIRRRANPVVLEIPLVTSRRPNFRGDIAALPIARIPDFNGAAPALAELGN